MTELFVAAEQTANFLPWNKIYKYMVSQVKEILVYKTSSKRKKMERLHWSESDNFIGNDADKVPKILKYHAGLLNLYS